MGIIFLSPMILHVTRKCHVLKSPESTQQAEARISKEADGNNDYVRKP
jgi:hypothetical protein